MPSSHRPSPSESGDQVRDVTETPAAIRSEFYEAYKREAKIFNKELKKCNKELNVTLLFVSNPPDACAREIDTDLRLGRFVCCGRLDFLESRGEPASVSCLG